MLFQIKSDLNLALRVGIVGAGSIGSAMAALLGRTTAEVVLVARGRRLEQVRRDGVMLDERGTEVSSRVITVQRLEAPVDVLVLCVKAQDIPKAIADNAAGIRPQTLVVPVSNGLPFWFFYERIPPFEVPFADLDQLIAGYVRPEQIVGAVLLATIWMTESGKAVSSSAPTLSLAPVVDAADTKAVERLCALLREGGVRAKLAEDIRGTVLTKLLINIATNPLSALMGNNLAEIGQDGALLELAFTLANECRRWAATLGRALPSNLWFRNLLLSVGAFPTSMLQDARAGRPLELDAICRAPLALAEKAGVSMPLLSMLTKMLDQAPNLPLQDRDRQEALRQLIFDTDFERIAR